MSSETSEKLYRERCVTDNKIRSLELRVEELEKEVKQKKYYTKIRAFKV